jgi:hypothetical protein
LLPGVPCRQQRRAVDAGVGVQQGAHGGRAGQALPGVLAVDVQQLLASSRSCAGGGRAVDPGAAAAGASMLRRSSRAPSPLSKPLASSQEALAGGASNSALISAAPGPRAPRASPRPAPAAARRSGWICRRRSRRSAPRSRPAAPARGRAR